MRLTRWTHSCVTLEHEGRTVVFDPGVWSEPVALHDADAVLVTHEHSDHVDELRLRGLGAPVLAPEGADLGDLEFTAVRAGDVVEVAGSTVRAVGGRHAAVVAGQHTCANLGYVVGPADDPSAVVYHPGDALDLPEVAVRVLLVPMQASWPKTAEAIDFVRAVAPARAIGIHDGQVDDRGRRGIDHWLAGQGGAADEWLEPGATTDC